MNTSDNPPAGTARRVEHAAGTLHVVDRPGETPPIVLMHGFPDDHHIYDRLSPLLNQRTIAFDFLGYGQSSRPEGRTFARSDRQRDLTAVIDALELDQVVLVGHDASGPEAIEWALEHPDRVTRLVLLNTYYGHATALRLPEMIRLLADPGLTPLADAMIDDAQQRLWLLAHTGKQFGLGDVGNPEGLGVRSIAPQFFETPADPDALTEIRAWTADLFDALDAQDQRVAAGDLAQMTTPVSVIFGANDNYLNPGLAHHLASLFGKTQPRAIENAGHWPQWDQPHAVAQTMTTAVRESTEEPQ